MGLAPGGHGYQGELPDADVACVTGEGSIQMNIQELSTVHLASPVKIVILNNGVLGTWFASGDKSCGAVLHPLESLPDFVKLAEAYGHVGVRITDSKDLKSKMEEAFAMKDRLVVIDISVDTSEHVYPMQIKDGSMRDMWLSKTERT